MRRQGRSGTRLLVAAGLGALLVYRARRRPVPGLQGKTVLVTGGSRGLGLALAREAARRGARVAICGRDPDALERARMDLERRGADVLAVQCDVSDAGAVQRLVDTVRRRFGPIDVLINNAGVIQVGPAEAMTLDDFEECMAANFWGTAHASLAVLPEMRARRSGYIVNITSIGGRLSVPHLLPYSASKFAAVGFSKGLRAEYAADGITVVTVYPGLMRTGSPRNATFRGRHRAEFGWFSVCDALPGLSVSAEWAARRILDGALRGEAELPFPITTRAAIAVEALAPGLVSGVLARVSRLLPGPPERPSGRRKGAESGSWISPSLITRLNDRAALRLNQLSGAERAPDSTPSMQ